MTMIAVNLQTVRARIAAACRAAGRPADSVLLLAVSKAFGPPQVGQALEAGQTRFGENYIQEAVHKIEAVGRRGIEWHCIGPIQSNKTRLVAEHFDWVHTVDRLRIAQRLSEQRPAHLPPLQVCLQVNISGGSPGGRWSDRRCASFKRSIDCTQSKCAATTRVLLLCNGPIRCHSMRSRRSAVASIFSSASQRTLHAPTVVRTFLSPPAT
jgi:uncharacterized pyridoxal phosphate-containing UPF0001 family protein